MSLTLQVHAEVGESVLQVIQLRTDSADQACSVNSHDLRVSSIGSGSLHASDPLYLPHCTIENAFEGCRPYSQPGSNDEIAAAHTANMHPDLTFAVTREPKETQKFLKHSGFSLIKHMPLPNLHLIPHDLSCFERVADCGW